MMGAYAQIMRAYIQMIGAFTCIIMDCNPAWVG
jgi:hypothetical protein